MSHLPATSQLDDLEHETSVLLDYLHNNNLPAYVDETDPSPTDLSTLSNFDQQGRFPWSFSMGTSSAIASMNEMSIESPSKRQASTSPSANTRSKRSSNQLVMYTRDDLVSPNPDVQFMLASLPYVSNKAQKAYDEGFKKGRRHQHNLMLDALNSLEDKVHQYRHKIADLQPLLQECYNQESRVQQRDQYAHKFRHEQPQSDKQTLFPSPTEQRQQQPPDYHQATGSTASAPSEKLMDMMALPFDNARTAEIRRMAAVLRIASTTIRAARCVKQSKL